MRPYTNCETGLVKYEYPIYTDVVKVGVYTFFLCPNSEYESTYIHTYAYVL